jgi:hypothetical protein
MSGAAAAANGVSAPSAEDMRKATEPELTADLHELRCTLPANKSGEVQGIRQKN